MPRLMLRITGSQDPLMWYADKIGELVPFVGIWPESGYASKEPGGSKNVVRFKDAHPEYLDDSSEK